MRSEPEMKERAHLLPEDSAGGEERDPQENHRPYAQRRG